MIKAITVDQVRVGMYLHEIRGSWINNPFWRSAFLLEDAADIEILRKSKISEILIDLDKGLDVADDEEQSPPQKTDVTEPAAAKSPAKPQKKLSAADERANAGKIIDSSRIAVTSMFNEARMGKAVDAVGMRPLVEEITASISRNSGALIGLARLKTTDDYTYMHSVAVCALMIALAQQMGLNDEETRQAGMAGLLHDIGKMGVPQDLLQFAGSLNQNEFQKIKQHPVVGHAILQKMEGVDAVTLDVCLHHHERMDGTGYPHHLLDEQISLFARMGAVCDVYDAITSNRPYKLGWGPGISLRKMSEWKGHFDQKVFQNFIKTVGIFPIGSLVLLESGRLAVVTDSHESSLLTPIVKVFFSTKSMARITEETIDLSKSYAKDKIISHEDPGKWDIKNFNEIWV
ncbi:HD-GYP domain-containing protein [Herbaspirillum sp. RTI4]|uniref:HD-GYP domain-containing protein n=1 Tax=Herbaspirillum sp. RTI4 TaxID=3048640 RepID=UPI002AB491A8|nr:HD-GYP domain-containing protein [Herbaspirillum sp. RTI4]MDY7578916.1 HD-GYP domain-containing protein [Herbaspirillum sp. RTI4]MEA9982005.1 HD-GYP domain-containing protein [Herbaspirillum sp. RTI4]